MTPALFPFLPATNGSTPDGDRSWLQESVQQFFCRFNWEDHAPEVQQLQQSSRDGEPIDHLMLTVNQFFSLVNWEGNLLERQEGLVPSAASPDLETLLPATPAAESFTLDDFSDLF